MEGSEQGAIVTMALDEADRLLAALSYGESIVRLRAEELADSEGTSTRVQTAQRHAECLRWGWRHVCEAKRKYTHRPAVGVPGEGLLHLWECPWPLRGPQYRNFERCGYISTGPGKCPYDHAEEVALVPLTALVLCSDCREPIMREDSRAQDGRLVCGSCALSEVAAEGVVSGRKLSTWHKRGPTTEDECGYFDHG